MPKILEINGSDVDLRTIGELLRKKEPVIRAEWKIEAYLGDLIYDTEGNILNEKVDELSFTNLIVNNGKGDILKRLIGTTVAAYTSGGVGTDSTAAAVAQIKLNPTVAGSVALQAADASYPIIDTTTTPTAPTATWKFTYGTGLANFAWNEGAIFNGTTNGTSGMLNRAVFGPFTKTAAVSIVMTVVVTQS